MSAQALTNSPPQSRLVHDGALSVDLAALLLNMCYFSIAARMVFTWYELYSVYNSDETGSLTARVASLGPTLVAWCILMLASRESECPPAWRRLAAFAGAVLLVGLAIGVWQGNSLRYLAGDAFRFCTFWMPLHVCIVAGSTLGKSSPNLLLKHFDRLILLIVFDAALTCWIAWKFPFAKVSTVIYLVGFFWALVNFRRRTWLAAGLFGVCSWALLVSGKRGPLMAIPPALLLGTMLLLRSGEFSVSAIFKMMFRSLPAVLLIGVIILLIPVFSPQLERLTRDRAKSLSESVSNIISDLYYGEFDDQSYDGRLQEVENVRYFYAENVDMSLAGAGFGAEVPIVADGCVESTPGMMHHVHIAWYLYFLRNGYLGILLMFAYFGCCGLAFFRLRGPGGRFAAFVLAVTALDFALAFKSNVLLESVPLATALAVCLANTSVDPASTNRIAPSPNHGAPR